jgi:hypothetical protein
MDGAPAPPPPMLTDQAGRMAAKPPSKQDGPLGRDGIPTRMVR